MSTTSLNSFGSESLMHRYLYLSLVGILAIFTACSNNCDMENPTVRLVNNGDAKADIQIKTSGGNTENINNIQPGSSSPPRSFSPGAIEFTIAIQGVNDPVIYNLKVFYCVDYTVDINPDNTVSGSWNERE
jgi:hypothetical protein